MSQRADHVLRLDDVVVRGRLRVPSLTLTVGITVVVGKNGAGKSTLLNVAAGIARPDGGRVFVDDVDVASLAPRERARRIASLGQDPAHFDDTDVLTRIAHGLAPRRGARAVVDHETRARVAAVADELALTPLIARQLGALSGGERRRAHVARALVDDNAVAVFIDEPFAGLDATSTALLVAALRRRGEQQIVVVSVHDVGTALALGGRLLGLEAGAIVVDGALPEALSQASVVWGDVKVVVDGDFVGVLQRRA